MLVKFCYKNRKLLWQADEDPTTGKIKSLLRFKPKRLKLVSPQDDGTAAFGQKIFSEPVFKSKSNFEADNNSHLIEKFKFLKNLLSSLYWLAFEIWHFLMFRFFLHLQLITFNNSKNIELNFKMLDNLCHKFIIIINFVKIWKFWFP